MCGTFGISANENKNIVFIIGIKLSMCFNNFYSYRYLHAVMQTCLDDLLDIFSCQVRSVGSA